MDTSDVLKVLKIARVVGECNFENSQNITSAHKSRNARASSYDFLFIIYSTKLLRDPSSLPFFRHPYVLYETLQWFPNAHMFYLNQSKISCFQKFLRRYALTELKSKILVVFSGKNTGPLI